ncbi:hypothetical protein VCRA2119O147_650024 [Vibrio crassostreae]|nr:hypothetical protein VCRA2113O120_100093 [Vibrio crassostreae]CAK1714623.1 hypothetical protein VCRA2114E123_110041 [Vibrio crassostreae]CAK1714982.1 hypothetical protein VCRA2114E122_110041 [Vibrio crassostreae]CAK1715350.1 hypothetical protein VCRA2113O119_110040 [Vibrio crassostreae]CAK1735082.1 hypothetical protein VCRA2110O113_120040 [Vibrio crassostreae]
MGKLEQQQANAVNEREQNNNKIKCSHIQRKTIHDLLSSLSQLNYNMVNSYRNHKFIHYMNHYTL